MKQKQVLYRVMDWGLGHATRNLPLIRRLVSDGHRVTVATCGRTLDLLKIELGDSVGFLDFRQDLPNDWGRDYHWMFILPRLPRVLPAALRSFETEHRRLQGLLRDRPFDLIVSDNCYGSSSRRVPSYFISHHLKVHWFIRHPKLQRVNEWLASDWINRFDRVLVPDYEDVCLSGNLSRDFRFIDAKKVSYIGILSGIQRQEREEDIDYFIPISGSEPQRTSFERLIFRQIHKLRGKVVVALGRPEKACEPLQIGDNITVHNVCSRDTRDELFSRARTVVARFGYSTLMDLIELRKRRAVFIPTPNHTEQEYLAWYHRKQRNFYSVQQGKVRLARDVRRARRYNGLPPIYGSTTQDSVDRFVRTLSADGAL